MVDLTRVVKAIAGMLGQGDVCAAWTRATALDEIFDAGDNDGTRAELGIAAEFNITVPEGAFQGYTTIAEIAAYVDGCLSLL